MPEISSEEVNLYALGPWDDCPEELPQWVQDENELFNTTFAISWTGD